jgi:hypothetical protein
MTNIYVAFLDARKTLATEYNAISTPQLNTAVVIGGKLFVVRYVEHFVELTSNGHPVCRVGLSETGRSPEPLEFEL